MLRTKTTLGGTGSINADNRGTEPAFVGVVAAQAAQSDFERLVRHRSKKNGEGNAGTGRRHSPGFEADKQPRYRDGAGIIARSEPKAS
jgi:hypothetical protein